MMNIQFLKCAFFALALSVLLSSSDAVTCNPPQSTLHGYGQPCNYNYECSTGSCSNSRCECPPGTTHSTCTSACVPACNTTVTDKTGTITSPGYPASLSPVYCTWTIQGTQGTIIAFNITDLDVTTAYECSSNYIELFDGPSTSSRTFGKMCTTWQTLTLSTTNYMTVVFRSSESRGFMASFYIYDYQMTLTEPQGFISSPGYPLSFPNDMTYTWTIQGDGGTHILLEVKDYDFQSICSDNYLFIYDGRTDSSKLFDDSCSEYKLRLMVSTINYMHIVLKTRSHGTFKGFYGKYAIRGNTTVLYESGKLVNPGYPNYNGNVLDMTWKLVTYTGTFIVLNITVVDTINCCEDYVTVYDGSSTSARSFDRFCNRVTSTVITSTTSNMVVNLRALHQNFLSFPVKFYAEFYSQGTINTLDASNGLIMSPGFPLSYCNKQIVAWRISSAEDTFIVLNIRSIDLAPALPNCSQDSLDIFEGPDSNSRLISRVCGNMNPGEISSTSNNMYIQFKAETCYKHRGFNATYYTIMTQGRLTSASGLIRSPGFPTAYRNNQNYMWTIQVDNGHFIVLDISTLDLGPAQSICSSDYVDIFDGSSDTSKQMTRLCGNAAPGLIASTSNYMHIVFRTDDSLTFRGFNATYSSQIRSGYIFRSSGRIASPGFPYVYVNNQQLHWELKGSYEPSFIILNITSLGLGSSPPFCSNNYLDIFEGPSNASRLLSRLCGNVAPVLISATSNQMYIVFKSESSQFYKGFTAVYYSQEKYLKDESGMIISPGFPITYRNNQKYSWNIGGGSSVLGVTIRFLTFELGPGLTSCSHSYLQIFNGSYSFSKQIARLCGNEVPEPISITSDTMHIVFTTGNHSTYKGFQAEYYIKQKQESCTHWPCSCNTHKDSDSTDDSDDLDIGEIEGIVVGSLCALALILGGIAIFIKRDRIASFCSRAKSTTQASSTSNLQFAYNSTTIQSRFQGH